MVNAIQISKAASFLGHKDCIYALEQENTHSFFTAGSDGMVVRWSLQKPDEGELFAQVANSVYALHILSEEQTLLVGQNHEGVYQIDLQSKVISKSAKITSAQIFDIKSFKNYILLATGDGYLIILSRLDLSVIGKLKVSDKSVRCISINFEHETFAIGLSDFTIRIFAFKDFKQQYLLEGHKNSVFSLAFSPDGKFLLSGSRDAAIKIWNSEENYSLNQSIPAHMFAINDIKFHLNGKYFATGSMDKTIKIWDTSNFRLLKVLDKARYQSHFTSINKILWMNNQLLSASDDKKIFLWDVGGINT